MILLYCYIKLHVEQSLTEEEAKLVLSSNGSSKSRMHGSFQRSLIYYYFVAYCVDVKDLMSNLFCIGTIILVVGTI